MGSRVAFVLLACSLAIIPAVADTTDGEGSAKGDVFLTCDLEAFRTVDWGIGHDISLPLRDAKDESTFMTPRNDGGDWKPFYWERSAQGRIGHCLEIRLVNPAETTRGCGVDWTFRGETAFPPDKEITVSVWTNCARQDGDYTNAVIGWQPGDFEGFMGGVQEYVKFSQRERESGWKLQTLTFRSHSDPKVGDVVGLAFGGRTSRKTKFEKDPSSAKEADCRAVVAVQPVLSAFFDDLTITVSD